MYMPQAVVYPNGISIVFDQISGLQTAYHKRTFRNFRMDIGPLWETINAELRWPTFLPIGSSVFLNVIEFDFTYLPSM